jgi:hypothetical protein
MNLRLHGERIVRGTHRRRLHRMPWAELPDGVFVLVESSPALVVGDRLVEWSLDGYGRRQRRPRAGAAEVITPPASVSALRAGYRPQIDESALATTLE